MKGLDGVIMETMEHQPTYLTPEETADLLRISVPDVWRRLESGQLQALAPGAYASVLGHECFDYVLLPPEGVRRILALEGPEIELKWVAPTGREVRGPAKIDLIRVKHPTIDATTTAYSEPERALPEFVIDEKHDSTPSPASTKRFIEQENAILAAIDTAGYDPLALPKNPPGKPGPKAAIRSALVGKNRYFPKVGGQFNKAWERMLFSSAIVLKD